MAGPQGLGQELNYPLGGKAMTQHPNSYTHHPKNNFTLIENALIRTPELSARAFKLLCIGLSHSGGWVFRLDQIATCFKESKYQVEQSMKELRSLGYLHLIAKRDADGKMSGHRWFWFADPMSDEEFKKFHRNGGFTGFGDLRGSENGGGLRRPIHKKTNCKKENNNVPTDSQPEPDRPPASVVVPSELDQLDLPHDVKQKVCREMDAEAVSKLVSRIKRWEGRESDLKAYYTIQAKWDTWSDEPTKEEVQKDKAAKAQEAQDRAEARKRQAQSIADRQPMVDIRVMSSAVEVHGLGPMKRLDYLCKESEWNSFMSWLTKATNKHD
jgi:hypothetical protein